MKRERGWDEGLQILRAIWDQYRSGVPYVTWHRLALHLEKSVTYRGFSLTELLWASRAIYTIHDLEAKGD